MTGLVKGFLDNVIRSWEKVKVAIYLVLLSEWARWNPHLGAL